MKYLILILGLCFYIQIQAQQKSESQRPPWMRGDLPIQTNHSYWFKQMYGEGKTLSEARQNATLALLGEDSPYQAMSLNRFFQAILTKNIMKRL